MSAEVIFCENTLAEKLSNRKSDKENLTSIFFTRIILNLRAKLRLSTDGYNVKRVVKFCMGL